MAVKVWGRVLALAAFAALGALAADGLPVGYDDPAADRGGPRLAGGWQWLREVYPNDLVLAPRPLWEEPTVFFITNEGGIDSIHELDHRFPMDVLHYWGNGLDDPDRFRELLHSRERIDCFVISRFNMQKMPPDVQYDILTRVRDGAGLVAIDIFDNSDTFNPRYLKLETEASSPTLIPGIPYAGLRQWRLVGAEATPVCNYWNSPTIGGTAEVAPYAYGSVMQSHFGAGPVFWVSTGTHWSRLGKAGRTLLPHISLRRDMWVENDYCYSHVAKTILAACGVAQPVRIRNVDAATGTISLATAGQPFAGKLRWQIRDTWGRRITGGETDVQCDGEGEVALAGAASGDGGRHFLDVRVEDGAGKTVDWGSGFVDLDRGVPPPVLLPDSPAGYARGTALTGKLHVPDTAGVAGVRLTLVDRYWRDVARVTVPPAITTWSFPATGLDGQIFSLHADLLDAAGLVLATTAVTLTAPHTRATRGAFLPVMTCSSPTAPELAARVEYLRRLGFLADRQYGGAGVLAAAALAWCDVQSLPFALRLSGATNDAYSDATNDWESPEIRADLREFHRTVAAQLRPFGLRGFNLTDDSAASKELPNGPYTTIAFHHWLERRYGSLEATAQAWGLKTSGWGRVREWGRINPASVRAWRDKGKMAPWIDAQRFLQDEWVGNLVACAEGAAEAAPDLSVGTDAAYYAEAIADAFGKVNYIAPYFDAAAIKLAVARGRLRRPGDYGACLGSYGEKPARMTGRRSQPLDVLFAGGNALYYWTFGVGLHEDLQLSDAHALYQCEVVEEISRGLGELFAGGTRVVAPIALLYSQTSGLADQLDKDGQPLTAQGNAFRAFQHVCQDLGYFPEVVTADELAAGRLGEHGIRLLMLPGCHSLSDGEVTAIRAFAESGGVVVADIRPGVRYPNGTDRPVGALDDLFGIRFDAKGKVVRSRGPMTGGGVDGAADAQDFGLTLADPRVQRGAGDSFGEVAATADLPAAATLFRNPCGAGQAFLFNASFASYDGFRGEAGPAWQAWYRTVAATVAAAGIAPDFTLTSNDRATPGIEFSVFRNGVGWLVGVADLNGADFVGARRPFALHLPGTFHVYDVRAGTYLGETAVLTAEIPRGGHRAYALLPYAVSGIEVTGGGKSAPGQTVEVAAKLTVPAGTTLARHVVRLEATGPDGEPFFPMRRVVSLGAEGTVAIPLRFAYGDRLGEWRFQVTDVATGQTAMTVVKLTGGDR